MIRNQVGWASRPGSHISRISQHRFPLRSRTSIVCSLTKRADEQFSSTVAEGAKPQPRSTLRMGLPSKGRMAEDTIQLFKECALSVNKLNPRQYLASIPQIPQLEVWFQRASDVVRKLRTGDVDLGIMGYDMYAELGLSHPDLIVVHEALDFGHCRLALAIPMGPSFSDVHTLEQLRDMPNWTAATPLRVVTGYHQIAERFFNSHGFQHYVLLSSDGALEAAPAMGSADIILDLVSTGVTLRENNLKEIQGGTIMESQGILVANKKSLLERPDLLRVVKELLDRFDAHLKAVGFFNVTVNMRGESQEQVAALLCQTEGLQGLEGPTVAAVYSVTAGGAVAHDFYAATICVPKQKLYPVVKALRQLGGSGVIVQPMTYIFEEEPQRWRNLLATLGLKAAAPQAPAVAVVQPRQSQPIIQARPVPITVRELQGAVQSR